MNDIADIYNSALEIINQRGRNYGGVEDSFERAAIIASMKLDAHISAYDVAVIMESVKDARRAVDPGHADSHIDGLNYRAFAMMFAPIEVEEIRPAPVTPPAAAPAAAPAAPPAAPPVKRRPGRPAKAKAPSPSPKAPPAKRGRGRPRKAK